MQVIMWRIYSVMWFLVPPILLDGTALVDMSKQKYWGELLHGLNMVMLLTFSYKDGW